MLARFSLDVLVCDRGPPSQRIKIRARSARTSSGAGSSLHRAKLLEGLDVLVIGDVPLLDLLIYVGLCVARKFYPFRVRHCSIPLCR